MIGPGRELGPYVVLTELGRGGMASLYIARRSGAGGFERRVAIKVVHAEHADDAVLIRMLLDEARLAAHVRHPNVVAVEELGEANGLPYLVMEYVDGVMLASVLSCRRDRQAHLPIDAAVAIGAQAADGLYAVHTSSDENGRPLGIVHRDVSPQNLMLGASGIVKMIDFGVAKAKGRLTSTDRGAVKGKVAYMSPEQVRGDPADLRSDVFALGVVLWEMLTLERLFPARNLAMAMHMVRDAKVSAPGTRREGVPAALDEVVLRALALRPEDRFQSARELRLALFEACPEARSVDASVLSQLVREAARDAAERARPAMADEVSDTTLVAKPAARHASGDLDDDLRRAGGERDPIGSLARLSEELLLGGRLDDAQRALEDAFTMPSHPGRQAQLAAIQARIAAARGDLSAQLAAAARARELYEQAGEEPQALAASVEIASAYLHLGALERADRALSDVATRCQELGLEELEARAHHVRGQVLCKQDRLSESSAELVRAEESFARRGDVLSALDAAVARVDTLCRAGRWSAARAEAERAADLADKAGYPATRARALDRVARAALATGDREGSLAAAAMAWRLAEETALVDPELALTYARALDAEGKPDEAAQVRALARARIVERIALIGDADWRRSCARAVPAHAELLGDADR